MIDRLITIIIVAAAWFVLAIHYHSSMGRRGASASLNPTEGTRQ